MSDSKLEPVQCQHCGNDLWAFTNVKLCSPWPLPGVSKAVIRDRRVAIAAADVSEARPFCPKCGWKLDDPARTKDEVIQDLMRELLLRGMEAGELQRVVGGNVSAIDLLAACYPKGGDRRGDLPPTRG